MTSSFKLIYGYDPLCGWCYGLIPALRSFCEAYPDIPVDVLPGGLFTGHPARPYSTLVDHIRSAEVALERVTGRKPGDAFHAMINQKECPVAASEPPSHAVLQMKQLAPERALEFAHLLQEVHYGAGKDLNRPDTYDNLCKENGFPVLDTNAIVNATLADPLVAQSFAKASELGVRSFPTILVADQKNTVVGVIQSIYEPTAFLEKFSEIIEHIRDRSG